MKASANVVATRVQTGPLAQALKSRHVLICVGAGGVGKTTIAASLALRAAAEGRSSIVCTIDPARRLANSLGLSELGNAAATISAERLRQAGIPTQAPLFAMMLDMKRTWDEFIERHAPPDKRASILSNRFYQSLSSVLAGSQEYIAMEKLWQLKKQGNHQLIVLDTPPTAHALDFLDAPNRVLDFLDNEAARWLLTPTLSAGKLGLQLFNWGGYLAKTLAKFTGMETLQELASFMLVLGTLNDSFRERARQVRELLASEETAFVLVTTPAAERLDEVREFHTLLKQQHMSVAAIVVNRVNARVPKEVANTIHTLPPALRQKMEVTIAELMTAAEVDERGMSQLQTMCEPTPLIQVPKFQQEVHDLTGLWRTSHFLVQPPGEPQAQDSD
jgi:anion-transporting  ArsA/GET3 family ATPase